MCFNILHNTLYQKISRRSFLLPTNTVQKSVVLGQNRFSHLTCCFFDVFFTLACLGDCYLLYIEVVALLRGLFVEE